MKSETRYKVFPLEDDIYQVVAQISDGFSIDTEEYTVFQGTISDCEAWLRLKEGGYL